jgi:hypothetical protein
VDLSTVFQTVEVGLALAIFVGLLRGGAASKFTPGIASWVGLGAIGIGLLLQLLGAGMGIHEWRGLISWLSMQRDTIWHGTTFLAFVYGVLGYAGVRAVWAKRREGDG